MRKIYLLAIIKLLYCLTLLLGLSLMTSCGNADNSVVLAPDNGSEAMVNQDPRVAILGEWELVKSVYGKLNYQPQYEFREDGTYTYTNTSGAKTEGKYSIHEESGDMITAERLLMNYDHFLRLNYNDNQEDYDDWGLVIVGDLMYLTGIHKIWTITPADIYHRKKS